MMKSPDRGTEVTEQIPMESESKLFVLRFSLSDNTYKVVLSKISLQMPGANNILLRDKFKQALNHFIKVQD